MKSIEELLGCVEEGIARLAIGEQTPAELYQPIDYILQLKGKRIRPVLVLAAFQSFSSEPVEKALPLALAVELFHNFTLIHDDIMDRAPTRRGKPTVHEIWGQDSAILAGDALFAYTMPLVVQNFPHTAAPLVTEYARIALEVCEGQALDMIQSRLEDVSVPQYLEMIRQKTAVLIGGALKLGAIAAGASSEKAQLLDQFGQQMGVAFQLQDDFLDVYAPADKFGKQSGGDIIENKKTFLWIRARQKADPDLKKKFDQWAATTDQPAQKVAAITAIYNLLDIPAETQQSENEFYAKAEATIQPLLSNEGIAAVFNFFQTLKRREI